MFVNTISSHFVPSKQVKQEMPFPDFKTLEITDFVFSYQNKINPCCRSPGHCQRCNAQCSSPKQFLDLKCNAQSV